MSSFDDLWDEFLVRFSRAPVWLPGTAMALGDVGVVDRRGYLRLSNLSDFGVGFKTGPSSVPSEYSVNSANATTQEVDVHGSGVDPAGQIASASTELRASFSVGSGFVVRASGVRGRQIVDVLEVERQIRQKQAERKFWRREWIYVQEVVTAGPVVLLVSGGSTAKATVRAEASAGLGSFMQLLNGGAALSVTEQSSLEQSVVTSDRAPLMWRGRWKRGLFKAKFKDRGGEGQGSVPGENQDAQGLYEDFDLPSLFERDVNIDDWRPR